MISFTDEAFSPLTTPEGLWRVACSWTSQGYDEQGTWLHDMAADLIEIRGLPCTNPPQKKTAAQSIGPFVLSDWPAA